MHCGFSSAIDRVVSRRGTAANANLRIGNHREIMQLADDLYTQFQQGNRDEELICALARVGVTVFTLIENLTPVRRARFEEVSTVRAQDLTTRAWQHALRGLVRGDDPSVSLVEYRAAAAAFQEAGNIRLAVQAHANVGRVYNWLGKYREAEEAFRNALRSAERSKLPRAAALARLGLGEALSGRGELDEGVSFLEAASADYRKQNDKQLEGVARTAAAHAYADRGELGPALDAAHTAVELTSGVVATSALAALARVRALLGDLDGAAEASVRAQVSLEEVGVEPEHEALSRWSIAEAAAIAGDWDETRLLIAAAAERVEERASKITSAPLRESYLVNVAAHRRIFERAKEWLVGHDEITER